jgi:hypothetical protein
MSRTLPIEFGSDLRAGNGKQPEQSAAVAGRRRVSMQVAAARLGDLYTPAVEDTLEW